MKTKISLIIALFFTLSACNNWLDIELDNKVEDSKLFSTPEGFEEALAGIYSSLSKQNMFGQTYTMEYIDVLAQYYSYSSIKSTYEYWKDYNYQNSGSKSTIAGIWNNLYSNISQANCILEWADKNASVLSESQRNQIRGEALGLRAFLHFEVLRYWGETPQNIAMEKIAIPYVTQVTKNPNSLLSLSYREVFEKILADLNEAETLLANDPITLYNNDALNHPEYEGTTAAEAAYPSNDFHFYRQIKFNYYAVKATKARYYLWLGDTRTAARYAREVIDAVNEDGTPKFKLADEPEASNGKMTFPTEHIFAVHNSNATSTLTSYFFNYQTMYTQNISSLQTAYETSLHTSDIRFKDERLWEERYEPLVSQPQNYFRKYYENETTAVKQMPLIRLSEMYFIAVENGDTDLFRTYRIARNLDASIDGTLTDQNAIMARLELEYRKDFYGEGQMFFFYKRLGYTSYTWPTVKTVESASYRLPIPETQANFE